jgi:glycosyltransferase involved in cell wall biosynthesis
MPIAILEALACGVPQVVTAIEGSVEAATSETARFFPPGDAGALATEVLLLLGAPDQRATARVASRARHQRFFRTERMVEEVSALYDRVAGAAD